jgi:hypothetical protein
MNSRPVSLDTGSDQDHPRANTMTGSKISIGRFLALCCFVYSSALGAIFSDFAALEQAQVFGQDPRFNSVGVVGLDFGDGFLAMGSGVVIGDGSWILLSGHQLNHSGIVGGAFAIRDSAGVNTEVSIAQSWMVYPGFTGTGTGQGVDLGLMRLSSPITSVTPANLYRGSVSDLYGETLSMAGFGLPGVAGQGLPYSRLRYAGMNVVNDVPRPFYLESEYLHVEFTAPNTGGLQLEWGGSPGDSGGPWMVLREGTWEVAAISSGRTSDPLYNFGNITYAMTLTGHLGWIDSFSAVPEPEHYAAAACALCLGWAMRRRRKQHLE